MKTSNIWGFVRSLAAMVSIAISGALVGQLLDPSGENVARAAPQVQPDEEAGFANTYCKTDVRPVDVL
jgi:hypothetical protein